MNRGMHRIDPRINPDHSRWCLKTKGGWRYWFLILLLAILITGCIDAINLNVEGNNGTLVVDGWITDQPGPYTVKLSRTIAYDNDKPLKVYPVPEKGAIVTIVDDLKNSEALAESSPGVYKTIVMRGVVGRSYRLLIQTADGNQYESLPDEMKPVPNVDELQFEYKIAETLYLNAAGDARIAKLQVFAIYALVTDPAEMENYYRWQVDGIFEFFSVTLDPETKQCWAPLTRLESKLAIASDLYTGGKPFRQYLANVLYDRPTKYLVKVRQQSLTESAYHFLQKINSQQTSTGTIFDPPPAPISGNMRNVNNSDEVVLGFFGATAIASSSILINRFEASHYATPVGYKEPLPGDCRTQEPNATNIKPEGF